MSTQETYPGAAGPIPVEVFTPSTAGNHPSVVVVYGTEGMNEPFGTLIRDFATALGSAGFVAVIPDYLRSTGTPAGTASVWEALSASRDTWVDSLRSAATFADGRAGANKGKLGIVGFSLGGNLALRLGKDPGTGPRVLAVVDFFAPISQAGGIGPNVERLAAVQIHHGTADPIVDMSQSAELITLLDTAHKVRDKDYFYYTYRDQGHGFTDPTAVRDSTTRTVDFLKQHLV